MFTESLWFGFVRVCMFYMLNIIVGIIRDSYYYETLSLQRLSNPSSVKADRKLSYPRASIEKQHDVVK